MINAGIAGLGNWGRTLVNSVQGKSQRIRFTAGCTGRRDRAEDYCRELAIDLRDNLDDLLSDPRLDAIVLATPHSQHAEQIAAAARVGKQVFVEKPFTLDKASAETARAAAEDAGIVLALGHNRRFLASMARVRELATSGALGTLLHVEGNFSASGALRYTEEHWRASAAESPAGGMTGLGVHMVDAFISFLGPIDAVNCISLRRAASVAVDDTTTMLLRFASGITGNLTTLFATERLWRLQAFGSAGWVEMRNYDRLVIRLKGEDERVEEFPAMDMEFAELEAFADACDGGAPYPLSLDDAVHGAAVLEAIITSAKGNGAWERVAR